MNGSGLQPANGFNHQISSGCGHSRSQSFSGIVLCNCNFLLQQDVTGIEPASIRMVVTPVTVSPCAIAH